jgi:hypothetical protein
LVEPQVAAWPRAAGAVLEAGELAQAPDVARVFDFPTRAVPQRLDDVAGVEQEGIGSGAQITTAGAVPRATKLFLPLLLGEIEQGGDCAGGGVVDGPAEHTRWRGRRLRVMATLDGVLEFESTVAAGRGGR